MNSSLRANWSRRVMVISGEAGLENRASLCPRERLSVHTYRYLVCQCSSYQLQQLLSRIHSYV